MDRLYPQSIGNIRRQHYPQLKSTSSFPYSSPPCRPRLSPLLHLLPFLAPLTLPRTNLPRPRRYNPIRCSGNTPLRDATGSPLLPLREPTLDFTLFVSLHQRNLFHPRSNAPILQRRPPTLRPRLCIQRHRRHQARSRPLPRSRLQRMARLLVRVPCRLAHQPRRHPRVGSATPLLP